MGRFGTNERPPPLLPPLPAAAALPAPAAWAAGGGGACMAAAAEGGTDVCDPDRRRPLAMIEAGITLANELVVAAVVEAAIP